MIYLINLVYPVYPVHTVKVLNLSLDLFHIIDEKEL